MQNRWQPSQVASAWRSFLGLRCSLSTSFLRAAVVGVVALCVTLMAAPRAQAQDAPDAPTAVAVYTVVSDDPHVTEGDELDVRWSSSDTTVTKFKIQWKSGTQEFASSREDEVTASTALVELSSTETHKRYKHRIGELTDGTEYTVRVIATNARGNSDPSSEATGTPDGRLRLSALAFVRDEVVNVYASDFPWLQGTLDYLVAQDAKVVFEFGVSGNAGVRCSGPGADGLQSCDGFYVGIGQHGQDAISTVVHELAHIYTISNNVTTAPAPVAAAHLYVHSLGLSMYVGSSGLTAAWPCAPGELYADLLAMVVLGSQDENSYWNSCPGISDAITMEADGVARSAVAGTMPSWFSTYYDAGGGELDLERVWANIRAVVPPDGHSNAFRLAIVYQLKDAFGGYCDNSRANSSAFGNGVARNPWRDGGCTPDAPGSVVATPTGSGKLAVSWSAPTGDGGSPITGYNVQWKSGAQEFDTSRQHWVSDPTRRQREISGLTNGVSHTVRHPRRQPPPRRRIRLRRRWWGRGWTAPRSR
ncbi:MAG: fibronectin type III domain-containing protein [Chloroflexota bacterium]|nr:fibronectin type III domain-containing protein [Chloroflexota bacterium]